MRPMQMNSPTVLDVSGTTASSPVTGAAPDVSVIIPTINEAGNLPLLLPRLAAAMDGHSYEVLIVDDDSRDATPAVCAELSRDYPLRLLVRKEATNGLSGAVVHGMTAARGECLVVMDADLQHPPESVPRLLAALQDGQAEFALGSRYAAGGSTEQGWGLLRRINSAAAVWLARPLAGKTADPMSGFFALRRSTYQRADRLNPLGYKIGLELMCKCRVRRVAEVPIHFAQRAAGQSKMGLRQQIKYLRHLDRLYDFRYPRLWPALRLLSGAACGWLLGIALATWHGRLARAEPRF